MRIDSVLIQGYCSLNEVSFQAKPLTVLIGSNGQGKSLVVEALYRFFTDFNVVGGASSIPISDMLWPKRDSKSPIRFEIVLCLTEDEIRKILPFDDRILKYLKEEAGEEFNKISMKRSLEISGTWKTDEIAWAGIALVTNDGFIPQKEIQKEFLPVMSKALQKYKLYFFSDEGVAGDRLVVKEGSKKAFKNNTLFDDIYAEGFILGSDKHAAQSLADWANKEGYQVVEPSSGIPEFESISATIQRLSTTMAMLRGKVELIPAARDNKCPQGERISLVEDAVLKEITSTSINRERLQEIKWEDYRSQMERLLHRRLEPNPSEILIKEGDLGLNVAYIGGGEQSLIGLIWRTLDTDKIYAIEEPENHLYPRKQKELFDHFKRLSKETQIIICTHSPVFAARSDICGVYLVSRDDSGNTKIEAVNESNVDRVIDELGIRASYQFEFDNVVFVEGDDDVKIFNALAKRVVQDADTTIGFIDAGGWNNMDYYANARILTTKRVKVGISAIFDGDTEKDERNRKMKGTAR